MIFSIQQYNSLQLNQKVVILGDSAVFLMSMLENETIHCLYYFCGFYVEVLFDADSGKLLDVNAFDTTAGLDKYLDNIVLVGF